MGGENGITDKTNERRQDTGGSVPPRRRLRRSRRHVLHLAGTHVTHRRERSSRAAREVCARAARPVRCLSSRWHSSPRVGGHKLMTVIRRHRPLHRRELEVLAVGKGWVVVRLGNSSAAKIPSFIALHKLFGEARQRSMTDLLAERVVQLGSTGEGAIQVATKRTELKIYRLHVSGERDHIDALSSAQATYARVRVAPSIRPPNSATRTPPIPSQGSRGMNLVSLVRRGTYRIAQRGEEHQDIRYGRSKRYRNRLRE